MKCPKCHYLSFDPEPRCRNCGYGFSLADADLSLKPPETTDALADMPLREPVFPTENAAAMPSALDAARPRPPDRAAAREAAGRAAPADHGLASGLASRTSLPEPSEDVGRRRDPAKPSPATTVELPLFVKGTSAEVSSGPVSDRAEGMLAAESVTPTAAPRTRTAPPFPPRKLGPLDRDLLEDLQRLEKREVKAAAAEARRAAREDQPPGQVGAVKRLSAALLDAALLGALGAAVVGVTLRWCELPFADVRVLPVVPTSGFLLLVGVGYLLMFTAAGGQTVGKMAFGLRVVGLPSVAGPTPTVTTGQAVSRACLTVPSVLMLGLGFLPALFGDERAVHDRIAQTRVVRA